ncbi:FecR family protein [Aquimarina amphilecti]|uniref:FecR family protein n=1 Tax=Aquimarina amphilecti TaxID=1038014 RepID=A0A1H7M0H5_AQUAM|nr:FecR family protein [Aquimarina amphilecti]SEL04599.1 FecR family protein [Aquimarina amphilecti]
MKEDKDLLKELLNTKFKDDVIESSGENFDLIFDAVQEKSDDKNLFYWYTAGFILLMIIGVCTIYYIKNSKTSNTNTEITSKDTIFDNENNNPTTTTVDSISVKKEENTPIIIKNESVEDSNQLQEDLSNKQIDVTTLEPEDEIIEKGVITVTYTASEKYAFTERTKYNTLPDSSTIVVRKNSKVNFTATKQGYRRADITGTVFLNINKDESKPFILFGKYCKVQITGNSFAIHSDTTGDLMTLIKGSAKVVHNNTKEVKILSPGQSLHINNKEISILEKSPNRFAWKTGKLFYQNASVNEIINDLGTSYDAKILLKSSDILNCKYSGSFKNKDISQILEKLTKSLTLELTKKDDLYIISGKGCNE